MLGVSLAHFLQSQVLSFLEKQALTCAFDLKGMIISQV